MRLSEDMQAHVLSGTTTLCRAWAVLRRDGVRLGFTDHDGALQFDDLRFQANSGLSATALQQATGLSVDNAEALGALTDAQVSEADIAAGRYDGAEVTCWLVNWADPTQRAVLFRGTFGTLERSKGAFRAELRGLSDALNVPLGRSFQKPCAAVLGDRRCGLALDSAGYRSIRPVEEVLSASVLRFAALPGFEPGWFSRGSLRVLSGAAKDAVLPIKTDETTAEGRVITLWQPVQTAVQPGDQIELTAGCDKRFSTCRLKFDNAMNFQGFPDIPGADWLMVPPAQSTQRDGGSRR